LFDHVSWDESLAPVVWLDVEAWSSFLRLKLCFRCFCGSPSFEVLCVATSSLWQLIWSRTVIACILLFHTLTQVSILMPALQWCVFLQFLVSSGF